MKERSASEVARTFSAVLDGAEGGETVVITRGGRRVGLLMPAPRTDGTAVAGVLERWRERLGVDDAVEEAVRQAGRGSSDLDGDPWRG